MQSSVPVACGTTNGSTAQIAEGIAEVPRKNGIRADAMGGLHAGRRHEDARPAPSPAVMCRHLSRRAGVMSDGRGWCASRNTAPV
jgi:hypothetical protein